VQKLNKKHFSIDKFGQRGYIFIGFTGRGRSLSELLSNMEVKEQVRGRMFLKCGRGG